MGRFVVLTAVFLLSVSATSFGQYTDQVREQIAAIKSALAPEWHETHNAKIDSMDHGASDSFSFTLDKGMSYKIVSVCDHDCSDLDMILYDENNNKLCEDIETDSMPICDVSPRWSGRFTLRVTMYTCSSNPCYYGIAILGSRNY